MKEVAKKAEDAEVTLNVEVVNQFEQFIMDTASEGHIREPKGNRLRRRHSHGALSDAGGRGRPRYSGLSRFAGR